MILNSRQNLQGRYSIAVWAYGGERRATLKYLPQILRRTKQ